MNTNEQKLKSTLNQKKTQEKNYRILKMKVCKKNLSTNQNTLPFCDAEDVAIETAASSRRLPSTEESAESLMSSLNAPEPSVGLKTNSLLLLGWLGSVT